MNISFGRKAKRKINIKFLFLCAQHLGNCEKYYAREEEKSNVIVRKPIQNWRGKNTERLTIVTTYVIFIHSSIHSHQICCVKLVFEFKSWSSHHRSLPQETIVCGNFGMCMDLPLIELHKMLCSICRFTFGVMGEYTINSFRHTKRKDYK